jgi:adenine-specific DNA-methyltransferase
MYEIQDAVDYYKEFEKPKIIIPAIVKSANYTYDSEGFFSNDKTAIIPTNDYHALGLLNSMLIDFYLKNIASTKQNNYFEYKPVYVSQLPIKRKENDCISNHVFEIINIRRNDSDSNTTSLETEIDLMVYKLYGLTYEEVKVVDPGFGMGKEEWDALIKS